MRHLIPVAFALLLLPLGCNGAVHLYVSLQSASSGGDLVFNSPQKMMGEDHLDLTIAVGEHLSLDFSVAPEQALEEGWTLAAEGYASDRFDPQTGALEWTPALADQGQHQLSIFLLDPTGLDAQTITVDMNIILDPLVEYGF